MPFFFFAKIQARPRMPYLSHLFCFLDFSF